MKGIVLGFIFALTGLFPLTSKADGAPKSGNWNVTVCTDGTCSSTTIYWRVDSSGNFEILSVETITYPDPAYASIE